MSEYGLFNVVDMVDEPGPSTSLSQKRHHGRPFGLATEQVVAIALSSSAYAMYGICRIDAVEIFGTYKPLKYVHISHALTYGMSWALGIG